MIKNMKITKNTKTFMLLIAFAVFTSFLTFTTNAFAATSAPAGINPVSTVLWGCTQPGVACGFTDFVNLINGMIQYGIELIGIAFVIALLYAGFLYLTSGGDPSKVKKVRDVLYKIMWGMIYTLCGWVIVYFIITSLGVPVSFYSGQYGLLNI